MFAKERKDEERILLLLLLVLTTFKLSLIFVCHFLNSFRAKIATMKTSWTNIRRQGWSYLKSPGKFSQRCHAKSDVLVMVWIKFIISFFFLKNYVTSVEYW